MPKPNTRFLRNILRNTDNHNASLKRRDDRERMRQLQRIRGATMVDKPHTPEELPPRGHRNRHNDERERERDDYRERERDGFRRHRRRSRDRDRDKDRGRNREKSGEMARRHRSSGIRSEDGGSVSDEGRGRLSRRHHEDSHNGSRTERGYDRSERESWHSHDRYHRHRRRHRTHDRDQDDYHRYHHRVHGHRRSASPRLRPHERYNKREEGTRHAKRRKSPSRAELPSSHVDEGAGADSDPLEELIGPLPPPEPVVRGRGANKSRTQINAEATVNGSAMDAHFAPDYDPATDVGMDDSNGHGDDNDDWANSLEALRDRALWRQRGSERLRAAGFDDAVVQRWERGQRLRMAGSGGADGDAALDSSFQWVKHGDKREWDRGKVWDEFEGEVRVRA